MLPKRKRGIANKFVGFVGKVPFERAIERNMGRHGSLVMSQRKPFSPIQRKAIARSIEKHKLKIDKMSQKSKPPKTLSSWKHRAAILQKMAALGFKPQALHLVAGLAFEHGLSKGKLLPAINEFRAANEHSDKALFEGSMGVPSGAVRLDLFSKIHGLLYERSKKLTVRQAATALGLDYNKEAVYSAINCAFGVLDLMGLTRKLPRDGKRRYSWVHVRHRFSPITIPKQNLDWKILQRLRKGELKVTDLCYLNKLPDGTTIGSKGGLADSNSISDSFLRLEKAGLVLTFGTANANRVRLSDFGAKLLQEQDKLDYLHPKLRIALLGLARQPGELLPKKQKMLRRIRRWIRVHMTLTEIRKEMGATSENPTAGYLAASRMLGEKSGYVLVVATGLLPWRGINVRALRTIYLEQIRKKNPAEAEYLTKFLAKQSIKSLKV